jgi:hypothetical protein
MPNESRILFNNRVRDAIVTVDTEATNRGKEKLTNNILQSPWRSTVITETNINFDFGAATSIAGMSLHFHNVVSGDTTYKWEADAAGDFSPADESETVTLVTRTVKEKNSNRVLTDVTRRDLYHLDAWEYRYYRLRITKVSGSYIEGGEVCIWKDSYQFAKNFVIGYTGGNLSTFANSVAPAGQVSNALQNSRFYLPMDFRNITDAQKDKLMEAGQSDYIAYIHGMNSKIYWGPFVVNPPVNVRTTDEGTPAELWNCQATFEESL